MITIHKEEFRARNGYFSAYAVKYKEGLQVGDFPAYAVKFRFGRSVKGCGKKDSTARRRLTLAPIFGSQLDRQMINNQ